MPVVPMKQILDRGFDERYGFAAINIFNDLTLDAVLCAAAEVDSPLIVQTSVKTVKSYGARLLHAMFTDEVVAEARSFGATVEGEIEAIVGVEDDLGSDAASAQQPLEVAVDFIRKTGIDCFAPSIGNKHGEYKSPPTLNAQRISEIASAQPLPMELHGGTVDANREFLQNNPKNYDPPSLFKYVRDACEELAKAQIRGFHGEGKAA